VGNNSVTDIMGLSSFV